MTKSLSKKAAWLLVFMMVLGMFTTPNIAEAMDAIIDDTEAGSYIKAEVSGADSKDYITNITLGGEGYGNVARGNIFLTFPAGTSLTSVSVTLTAQKEFGFTINGITVNAGASRTLTLNLTQENTATLDVSSDPDFDEGSYVITGGIADEEVTVITEINVDNPRDWLEGTYEVPDGYTIPYPEDYPDTADIQDAIDGFDSDTLFDIYNVPVGTTAMDVLALFGMDHNMNITGIPQGYISRMGRNGYNQTGEFDINFYSGWMYTLDEGEGWYFPNVGASAKTFNSDTEMIWHFTMAYGADIGAPWGEPGGETPGPGPEPPVDLPNNTGELLWPVDSYEITLWFGPVDEQYTVENKGMNIQGEVNSDVLSVCNGIVSYKGYSPVYGNIIYVNFNYNGKPMQVRYGHLTDPSSLNVGARVYKGNKIGRMAEDPDRDKGVIEIVFCKSTDGKICKNTGENIEFAEPTLYIDKKPAYSTDYLSEPFATVLDTTGLAVSEATPNFIWPWEDETDPDVRYKEDLDLDSDEGYLRKLLAEYGKEIDKTITSDNLEEKNILAYSDAAKLAIVSLNSRTASYGESYGNGVIKNNRMVVDKEQLWYNHIGETWYCPEGGTWTALRFPTHLYLHISKFICQRK